MEPLLAELELLLYGLNYQVFLRAYRVPPASHPSAERYIGRALGSSAVIGGVFPVTGPEVLAEVEQGLRYGGDAGSGPDPAALRSSRYEVLVNAFLSELRREIDAATTLAQFWLREGHPAYPVFWDFAFLIAGTAGATVFIGSSSD